MSAETETVAYNWAKRALIAIGAIGVLGAVAVAVLLATMMWRQPGFEPARVDTAQPGRGYTIGDVTVIAGTPLVRINVSEGERSGGSSYYSYSADDLRNILMLDSASGRNWRLMPDNNRRIHRSWWFPAASTMPESSGSTTMDGSAGSSAKHAPDFYFLFLVSSKERYDAVAGTIDGQRRSVVMANIDGIDGAWMRDARHLAIVVRERGKLYYRQVDMATLRTISSRLLAIE